MKNFITKGALIVLVAAATTFSMSSCKDVLDEVVYSELGPDNAFQTKADAQAAVNGVYERQIAMISGPITSVNDLCTDVCYKGNNLFEVLNEAMWPANGDVLNMWNNLFQMETRANIAIDQVSKLEGAVFIEGETGETITEELGVARRDALLSEAYFLRAFALYNLTDVFLNIPMTISSDEPTANNLPLTSIEDVDKQIISDLEWAQSHGLTEKWSSRADAGRATIGSVKGYLMRVYMRAAGRQRQQGKDATENWTKALGYANDILALRDKGVYSLQPKLFDNIYDPNSEDAKYNNELIYAIHSNPNSSAGTSWTGLIFTPWSYDMGWDIFSVPLELYWKMDKTDSRYTELIVDNFQDVYGNPVFYIAPETINEVNTIYKEYEDEGHEDLELGCVYTLKYKYNKAGTYNYNTGNNMILLRLADVLLCKAEILNELNGPSQEVADLVNEVRMRAFAGDATKKIEPAANKDAMRIAICDERAMEFHSEPVRRPDLIRMGLWKQKMEEYIDAIKAKTIKQEDNYVLTHPGKPRPDYSPTWMTYPHDLTADDERRYFPTPKRETDINPLLLDNRKPM